MAVKQNNTEENNTGSTVRPDSVIETESAIQQQNKSSGDTTSKTSINSKNQKKIREDNFQHKHNNHKLNETEDEQSFNNNSQNDQKNCLNLQMLIEYFYKIAYDEKIGSSTSAQNIVLVANQLLNALASCPVPTDPQQLKNFKLDIQKVGEIFMKVGEKNHQFYYLNYLQQVMNLITSDVDNNKQNMSQYPSCSIAIIFQLFPEESIPKAVLFIFSSNDMLNNDQSVIRTVKLLSIWLRQCTFCTHLNIWILAILNQLREQRKYELLIDIIRDIIEPIFIALIIPIFRPKVYPIILQTLTSIKDTPIIFHKIIGRAPKVIKQLKRELLANDVDETRKIYQELIDLIAALIEHFPGYNNLYKEMEEVLADCNISHYYRAMLENSIWGPDSLTLSNSTNPRVGLVNLGNTCYMNSVLQALVMTKDFCRELLLADINSPLIFKVQQLFAQLLHSQRPELTPTIVLHATRPPYFLPGFQQDSSEFLGYLLETFHEQETNLLTKQIKNVDQELDKSIDDDDLIIDKKENEKIKLNVSNSDSENMEIDSEDSNNTSPTTIQNVSSTQNLPPTITVTSSELTKTPSTSHQQASSLTTQINNKIPLTIIDKIFTGKMAITYKCLTCGWKSKNHDAFRDFPLSFPEVKNNSQENYNVQELLDYYCSPEILNGDNQYYCEQCKKCCDAERLMNVIDAPKNLILTLKQFKYDQNNHMRAKLMHKVFHDENVTLKVYNSNNSACSDNTVTHTDENIKVSDNTVTDTDKNTIYYKYELYAAVVHTGFSMDSGHYYTYATDNINNDSSNSGSGGGCNNPSSSTTTKNDNLNEWYKFNDNIVTACKITELHKLSPPNTPYILFYRMQSKYIKIIDGMKENKLIENIKIPKLPTLDELPSYLRDIVNNDNLLFIKENRLRQNNNNSTTMNTRNISRRGGGDEDDNQPPPPPPPSNCGGNALDININNYIF